MGHAGPGGLAAVLAPRAGAGKSRCANGRSYMWGTPRIPVRCSWGPWMCRAGMGGWGPRVRYSGAGTGHHGALTIDTESTRWLVAFLLGQVTLAFLPFRGVDRWASMASETPARTAAAIAAVDSIEMALSAMLL